MHIPCRALLLVSTAIALNFSFSGVASEIRGKPISPLKKTNAATNEVAASAIRSKPVAHAPAAKSGDYIELAFDKLAGYTFEIPEDNPSTNVEPKSSTQIPADVKAFDQKKVFLRGFMLPLKVDDGVVTEMLLMKDQSMCCYGAVPRINDWVSVKMKNGGVKSVMDEPVTLYGKLRVGEMLENGYLVGIYEMEGHKMGE